MRESVGSTKPKGATKVKVGLLKTEVGSRALEPRAHYRPLWVFSATAAPGGARAYTLGPERW